MAHVFGLTQDILAQAVAAARDGDLDTLAAVLARSPEVISATDADGRTLLDLACALPPGTLRSPWIPELPASTRRSI